jgi:protein-S-isoprenylcysteine O-methyltransferase Ste14
VGKRFPAVVYLAGLVVETAVRAPYERRRRQIPKTDQRVSRTERGLLVGLFVSTVLLPVVYCLTSWLDVADYRLSPRARARTGWSGAVLLATAVWLFWRAHRDLGAYWSPSLEIGAQHTLITNGVYGVVRHPMYASALLWGLGQTLLLPNWIAGPSCLAAFLPLYFLRVPREERVLLDHFGAAYRAYSARTGRIVPRLAVPR